MDELEKIKQKKLKEIQEKQQEQLQEELQLQQQIQQLEAVVKQFLTKEALQRYGNLKTAHPDKAMQLLIILGQAIQQGQITEQITDEKLKSLLRQLEPPKQEFKITKK